MRQLYGQKRGDKRGQSNAVEEYKTDYAAE
jgi:hypothetical protein